MMGSIMMIGGNLYDNNSLVYDTLVHLAGGREVARIGNITAASSRPC